jgi:hypothetical protein
MNVDALGDFNTRDAARHGRQAWGPEQSGQASQRSARSLQQLGRADLIG